MTHTPGPWKIYDEQVLDYPRRVAIQTVGKYPETLADLRLSSTGELPVNANARLIAAAPELLAALERIVYAWDATLFDNPLATLARDAIAKATE